MSDQPIQQRQQLRPRRLPAELGHGLLFELGVPGLRLGQESLSFCCQMQRIGALVLQRWNALDQAALFKPMHKRNEVRALDAQNLGDFRLLAARIIIDQHQHRIFRWPQFQFLEDGKKFLEHTELGTAQPVTDN